MHEHTCNILHLVSLLAFFNCFSYFLAEENHHVGMCGSFGGGAGVHSRRIFWHVVPL